MKLRLLAAAVAALTLTAGIAGAQDMNSDKGKLSYFFGYRAGAEMAGMAAEGEQIDINAVIKGLQDAYAKKDPALTEAQLKPALEAFQRRQQARAQQAQAQFNKAAADNKVKSDQFVAQYRTQPGVKPLAGGVLYREIEAGRGAKPTQANTVTVQFIGPFPLNMRPQQAPTPESASIKVSEISMPGIREVVQQMSAGAKWEVVLPPEKAFGADPRSGFPPNAAAVYEIKLISIK